MHLLLSVFELQWVHLTSYAFNFFLVALIRLMWNTQSFFKLLLATIIYVILARGHTNIILVERSG